MTIRSSPFGHEAFSLAEGSVAGIPPGSLRGPRFARPYRGVRQWADAELPDGERERTEALCRRYVPRLLPGQFFSHTTALRLWGAPSPPGATEVLHVAAMMPAQPPRTRGVIGHRLRPRESGLPHDGALPVEQPARAWAQSCGLWSGDAMIAAADHLIHRSRRLVTLDDLAVELSASHRGRFRPLLAEVRDGAESPKETDLRLLLCRAGLPEPELNPDVFDAHGTFIARLDLAFPRWRVGVEFDGRQHADDAAQFQRDADRWDDIRDAGWVLVRVLNHHLTGDGPGVVARVSRALWAAGWRPGDTA
ncbi:endonuclease domain-containing protein [Microbacterium gorillae]|uniref:endonuclease domain-containing protein n=1 Tax=Microbacterium gorillae TaxID=1231063 RepID=UPI000693D44E|nr:hypothetical protein [Microbacterium gorillae]